ncbi:hypothetical protein BTO02_08945 [Paraburkholderia sp. SOS3]|nr:hypothetical protein BTO02_08945 [Paraburkholderia sp. SOS3]
MQQCLIRAHARAGQIARVRRHVSDPFAIHFGLALVCLYRLHQQRQDGMFGAALVVSDGRVTHDRRDQRGNRAELFD